jgi:hypothetical protein
VLFVALVEQRGLRSIRDAIDGRGRTGGDVELAVRVEREIPNVLGLIRRGGGIENDGRGVVGFVFPVRFEFKDFA